MAKAESSIIKQMLTSSEESEISIEEIGDIIALSGVRRFPVRIKCATLAWHTFEAALNGDEKTTTE